MKHKTLKTMLMVALSAVILANPAAVRADQADTDSSASATVSEESATADNEAENDASAAPAEAKEDGVVDTAGDTAAGTIATDAAAKTEDKTDDTTGEVDGKAEASISEEASSEDLKTYDLSDPEGYVKALSKAKGTDEMADADEESVTDLTDMYGIFDIVGLKYEKNNPTGNITRLNRHVTYDFENFYATDYIHQHYGTVCGKAGYIIFALPKGYGDKVTSFDLYESTVEGSAGIKVAGFSKSNTKTVFKINSPSFFSDKDCYAVYFNKFNLKAIRYYSIRPIEAGGVQGDGGYSLCYEPSPDKVSDVSTTPVNASKVKITWSHDACVKKYEIYRSIKPVASFAADEDITDLTKYSLIGSINGAAALKKGMHSFTDKKIPAADIPFYYIIKPIITTQLASEEYYDLLYCSDPIAGEASLSKAKVKALNVSCPSLGKFKLNWKGLKNVEQYTITRYKNGEFDDEFDYPVTKKTTAAQTYTDNDDTIRLGVNYYYTIRPTSDSADGKKTKSAVISSVPSKVVGLKTEKKGNSRGAYLTWTDNAADRKAANRLGYDYRYQVKIDNGDWNNVKQSNYDDTSSLKAGTKRTYTVKAVCVLNNKVVSSSETSINFKVSDTISFKNETGGEMSSDSMYVAVGKTAYYRAYSSSNSYMSVHRVDDNSYVDVSGSMSGDYLIITLRGNRVGEQDIEVTSEGGGKKTIKVKVVPQ